MFSVRQRTPLAVPGPGASTTAGGNHNPRNSWSFRLRPVDLVLSDLDCRLNVSLDPALNRLVDRGTLRVGATLRNAAFRLQLPACSGADAHTRTHSLRLVSFELSDWTEAPGPNAQSLPWFSSPDVRLLLIGRSGLLFLWEPIGASSCNCGTTWTTVGGGEGSPTPRWKPSPQRKRTQRTQGTQEYPENTEYPENPGVHREPRSTQRTQEYTENPEYPENPEYTEYTENPENPEYTENTEYPENPGVHREPRSTQRTQEYTENPEYPENPEYTENTENPEYTENTNFWFVFLQLCRTGCFWTWSFSSLPPGDLIDMAAQLSNQRLMCVLEACHLGGASTELVLSRTFRLNH
ncbi:IgA FC receptor [Dissostichus eleginoides]|uniref:IgA FC receptor n=1 Tax=Dissostichus eleginoides TaxID=100907 RepID=A0AAD9F2N3_DISEL|nr:IgA FC receptor [Dissostichus eleginoides]